MNDNITIAEAALKVLITLGKAASVDEIYSEILKQNLYQFNTPVPEHVLRTAIRRHTKGVERIDATEVLLFELVGDDMYNKVTNIEKEKKQSASGMKRIQRASDKDEITKSLMTDQVGVFKEIWRLLLFAAQIGYKNNSRKPLNAVDPGKGIDQSTFGNCPAWPGVLYLMALAESESSDSLSGTADAENTRIEVFQEYANGGLLLLKDFFSNRTVDLNGLLAFIDTQKEEFAGSPNLEILI